MIAGLALLLLVCLAVWGLTELLSMLWEARRRGVSVGQMFAETFEKWIR